MIMEICCLATVASLSIFILRYFSQRSIKVCAPVSKWRISDKSLTIALLLKQKGAESGFSRCVVIIRSGYAISSQHQIALSA